MNQFQFRDVAPMRTHSPKSLNVDGVDAPCPDYDLAREIAPYAALSSLVSGKRVLDVGCRSASGARLLSGWGQVRSLPPAAWSRVGVSLGAIWVRGTPSGPTFASWTRRPEIRP